MLDTLMSGGLFGSKATLATTDEGITSGSDGDDSITNGTLQEFDVFMKQIHKFQEAIATATEKR